MAKTGWECVHCGARIYDKCTVVCPNCEKNPFEAEPDELLHVPPRKMRRTKKIENHQQR
jgi:hypothetical protein